MAGLRTWQWPLPVFPRSRRRDTHRDTSWRRHLQLIELVHTLQEVEDSRGLDPVDERERETNVDVDVIACLRLGHVLQTDALLDPPKSTLPMSTSSSR